MGVRHAMKKLFQTILSNNGFYEQLGKYKNNQELICYLSNDYLDNTQELTPYEYLDTLENALVNKQHNSRTIMGVVMDLIRYGE